MPFKRKFEESDSDQEINELEEYKDVTEKGFHCSDYTVGSNDDAVDGDKLSPISACCSTKDETLSPVSAENEELIFHAESKEEADVIAESISSNEDMWKCDNTKMDEVSDEENWDTYARDKVDLGEMTKQAENISSDEEASGMITGSGCNQASYLSDPSLSSIDSEDEKAVALENDKSAKDYEDNINTNNNNAEIEIECTDTIEDISEDDSAGKLVGKDDGKIAPDTDFELDFEVVDEVGEVDSQHPEKDCQSKERDSQLHKEDEQIQEYSQPQEGSSNSKVSDSSKSKFDRIIFIGDERTSRFDSLFPDTSHAYVDFFWEDGLSLDNIVNFVKDSVNIPAGLRRNILLVCCVGMHSVLKSVRSESCASDHPPFWYGLPPDGSVKEASYIILKKYKDVYRELKEFLGDHNDVVFTSVYPIDLLYYHAHVLRLHKMSTLHKNAKLPLSPKEASDASLKILDIVQNINNLLFAEKLGSARGLPTWAINSLSGQKLFLLRDLLKRGGSGSREYFLYGLFFPQTVSENIVSKVRQLCSFYGRDARPNFEAKKKFRNVVIVGDRRVNALKCTWPTNMLIRPQFVIDDDCSTDTVADILENSGICLGHSFIIIFTGFKEFITCLTGEHCEKYKPCVKLRVEDGTKEVDKFTQLLLKKMLNLKRRLKSTFRAFQVIYVFLPFDAIAYQKYLDEVHASKCGHPVQTKVDELTERKEDILKLQKCVNTFLRKNMEDSNAPIWNAEEHFKDLSMDLVSGFFLSSKVAEKIATSIQQKIIKHYVIFTSKLRQHSKQVSITSKRVRENHSSKSSSSSRRHTSSKRDSYEGHGFEKKMDKVEDLSRESKKDKYGKKVTERLDFGKNSKVTEASEMIGSKGLEKKKLATMKSGKHDASGGTSQTIPVLLFRTTNSGSKVNKPVKKTQDPVFPTGSMHSLKDGNAASLQHSYFHSVYGSSKSTEQEAAAAAASSAFFDGDPSSEDMRHSVQLKALRTLWKVHQKECEKYRYNPSIHPDFNKECRRFMGTHDGTSDANVLEEWNQYWAMRMEVLFRESWEEKRNQCLNMLTKESALKSQNRNSAEHRRKRSLSFSPVRSHNKYSGESSKMSREIVSHYPSKRTGSVNFPHKHSSPRHSPERHKPVLSPAPKRDSNIYANEFSGLVRYPMIKYDQNSSKEVTPLYTEHRTPVKYSKDTSSVSYIREGSPLHFSRSKSPVDFPLSSNRLLTSPLDQLKSPGHMFNYGQSSLSPLNSEMVSTVQHKSESYTSKKRSFENIGLSFLKGNSPVHEHAGNTVLSDVNQDFAKEGPSNYNKNLNIAEIAREVHNLMETLKSKQDAPKVPKFSDRSWFMEMLKNLSELSVKVGTLGVPVAALYVKALEVQAKNEDPLSVVDSSTEPQFRLLITVLKKLLDSDYGDIGQKSFIQKILVDLNRLIQEVENKAKRTHSHLMKPSGSFSFDNELDFLSGDDLIINRKTFKNSSPLDSSSLHDTCSSVYQKSSMSIEPSLSKYHHDMKNQRVVQSHDFSRNFRDSPNSSQVSSRSASKPFNYNTSAFATDRLKDTFSAHADAFSSYDQNRLAEDTVGHLKQGVSSKGMHPIPSWYLKAKFTGRTQKQVFDMFDAYYTFPSSVKKDLNELLSFLEEHNPDIADFLRRKIKNSKKTRMPL